MNKMFPNKIWNYKNFNMGIELDIAGMFIYDGIHTLNQMGSIDEDAMLFSFLYHVSVGLERLQKIVIVLIESIDFENIREFEKSLITHNHSELNKKICENAKPNLNSRENEFLQLISRFYNSARYHRFNLNAEDSEEQALAINYIDKHIPKEKIQYDFMTKKILISDNIKELFGKVIGSISKKYYDLVREGCEKNQTFTYELFYGSKAQKLFVPEHRDRSLQQQKKIEMITLKELLVYLRNTKDNDSFIRFIQEIPPLELDSAFLNEYIYELSKGIIPQSLIEEVEFLYEKNSYSKDRKEMVDQIGNLKVMFGYEDIHNCYKMLDDLVNGNSSCKYFAKNFPQLLELVEYDDVYESLKDIPELCNSFLVENKPNEEIFIETMLQYHSKLKDFGCF